MKTFDEIWNSLSEEKQSKLVNIVGQSLKDAPDEIKEAFVGLEDEVGLDVALTFFDMLAARV